MLLTKYLPLLSIATAAFAAPTSLETNTLTVRDETITTTITIDNSFIEKLEELFRENNKLHNSSTNTKLVARATHTRNDVENGLCNDVILIHARGTTEAGNIGTGLGLEYITAVEAALPGRVIAQGVLPYPANIAGYLAGGSDEGARSMGTLTKKAASQCPNAKIVLSGYSQGAQVVHLAVEKSYIPSTLNSRIAAVILYGDPKKDQPLPGLSSKTLVICNSNDLICRGLPIPGGEHSADAYSARHKEAVAYIKARV